jgi:hypothetical protein
VSVIFFHALMCISAHITGYHFNITTQEEQSTHLCHETSVASKAISPAPTFARSQYSTTKSKNLFQMVRGPSWIELFEALKLIFGVIDDDAQKR